MFLQQCHPQHTVQSNITTAVDTLKVLAIHSPQQQQHPVAAPASTLAAVLSALAALSHMQLDAVAAAADARAAATSMKVAAVPGRTGCTTEGYLWKAAQTASLSSNAAGQIHPAGKLTQVTNRVLQHLKTNSKTKAHGAVAAAAALGRTAAAAVAAVILLLSRRQLLLLARLVNTSQRHRSNRWVCRRGGRSRRNESPAPTQGLW